MLKRLFVALAAFLAFSVFAADVNTATQADLEAVKGIGPAIATKILDARKSGNFKDWSDLVTRVKGIGAGSASKLSAQGLTVNGATYAGAPAAASTAKTATPAVARTAASTATPAVAAKPAVAPSAPAASAGKMSKKERKAAAAASAAASK